MAFAKPIRIEPWNIGSDLFQDMVKVFNPKGLDIYFIKQLAGDTISTQEKMTFEGNRLQSFLKWPNDAKAYASQLSSAGFYFSGEVDEVTCFACNGKIKDWKDTDVPIQKHKEMFPTCPLILGDIVGVNLLPPNFDDKNNLSIQNLLQKTNKVLRKTTETSQIIAPSVETPNSNTPAQLSDQRQRETTTDHQPPTTNDHQPQMPTTTPPQLRVPNHSRNNPLVFRQESERLKSFDKWSDTCPVTPNVLAKAGFYFCGPKDMVQCAFCYGKLEGWLQSDIPLIEHAKHFPNCSKFGKKQKTTNVRSLVNAHPMNYFLNNNMNNMKEEDLGIFTFRPLNPQFTSEASRVESYKNNWPTNLVQNPKLLSSAGFYRPNRSQTDEVKCFCCDGGLVNFDANDDPLTEHARWFPECEFIKLVKGDEFIQNANKNIDPKGIMGVHDPQSRIPTLDQMRQIRTAMSAPCVVMAELNGIPTNALETAIRERLLDGRGHFTETQSLIDAAIRIRDRSMVQISTATAPTNAAAVATPINVASINVESGIRESRIRGSGIPTLDQRSEINQSLNQSINEDIRIRDRPIVQISTATAPTNAAAVATPINVASINVELGEGESHDPRSRIPTRDQRREIRAAMSNPRVIMAELRGISKNAIETAITERLLDGRGHFEDTQPLIDAAIRIRDRPMVQISTATAPTNAAAVATPINVASINVELGEGESDDKNQNRVNHHHVPPPSTSKKMGNDERQEFLFLSEMLKKISNLEEENERLKGENMCVVCYDEKPSIVFFPCHHMITCSKCMIQITKCPTCRKQIQQYVSVFL